MRSLCNAIFDSAQGLLEEVIFRVRSKRNCSSGRRIAKVLRDMFSDVRMLAYDTGLMEGRLGRLELGGSAGINGKPRATAVSRSARALFPHRRRNSTGICEFLYAARYYPVVLQRRVLRLRVPRNCIHPTPDERVSRHRRCRFHRPRGCVELRCLGVSACRLARSARDPARGRATAVRRRSTRVYPERPADVKLPRHRRLARVIPGARGACAPPPADVPLSGPGPPMYAADELTGSAWRARQRLEKLPTPYGLVRAGVAPDHRDRGSPAV